MEAFTYDSRILTSHLPSLCHLSTVSVALSLLNDFGITTLNRAFLEIQRGDPTTSNEGSEENRKTRAKEKLLLIPPLLRKSVLEAVHGMQWEIVAWESQHFFISKYKDGESFFHWTSNGKIDTIKMAQQLVLDQSINIKTRFEIACKYCLEINVQILWAEMEASGKTKRYKTADNTVVRFWVRWLREGSRVPWTQAAGEYLNLHRQNSSTPYPRYIAFFPSLRPQDRKKFLIPLQSSLPLDFLLCLNTMTKEEQEEVLRESALDVLYFHLNWPLQSSFLETAEKLYSFIDTNSFRALLSCITRLDFKKDFDYNYLFRELWNRSPDHLKESARKDPNLRIKIDSCVDEIKRKRIADNNEFLNSKRYISSDTNIKNKRNRKN